MQPPELALAIRTRSPAKMADMKLPAPILWFLRSRLSPFAGFVVACVVGVHYLSWMDARNVEQGKAPHWGAHVVGASSDGLQALELRQLDDFPAAHPDGTFLLPQLSGKVPVDGPDALLTYKARKLPDGSQEVQAHLQAETRTFVRYIATAKKIRLQYTRVWYHGFLFWSIPWAFAVALALSLLGRKLKRGPPVDRAVQTG